jgi:hypothetical protein
MLLQVSVRARVVCLPLPLVTTGFDRAGQPKCVVFRLNLSRLHTSCVIRLFVAISGHKKTCLFTRPVFGHVCDALNHQPLIQDLDRGSCQGNFYQRYNNTLALLHFPINVLIVGTYYQNEGGSTYG